MKAVFMYALFKLKNMKLIV